jgi:hypothetical protein
MLSLDNLNLSTTARRNEIGKLRAERQHVPQEE